MENYTYHSGLKTFIDKETNEEIQGFTVITALPRNNFEVVYLANMFNILDFLSKKGYTVFKYIVQHKDRENMLTITNRELAEKTGVSLDTVTRTLKELKKSGAITTKPGVIWVNPKIMNKVSAKKEFWLFKKFQILQNQPAD